LATLKALANSRVMLANAFSVRFISFCLTQGWRLRQPWVTQPKFAGNAESVGQHDARICQRFQRSFHFLLFDPGLAVATTLGLHNQNSLATLKALANMTREFANAFSVRFISFCVTQGYANPGRQFANAFGVSMKTDWRAIPTKRLRRSHRTKQARNQTGV
jgi:hypothetical protein